MIKHDRTPPRTHQAGFSLVEVIVAAAILMICFLAIATMQSNMARENKALAQRMEMSDFGRLLSQILSDENLCQCNLAGTPLKKAPDGSLYADYNRLRSNCVTNKTLVQVGDILPSESKSLPISRIAVTGMVDSGSGYYTGVIEVTVADAPNANTQKLIRPLAPARVPKKLFVKGGAITACGASEDEYFIRYGTITTSPLDQKDPVRVPCPAGMIAVSGGWRNEAVATLPKNCPEHYAAVMTNAPDVNGTDWLVLVLCHRYTPFVTCYRPNFQKGP